MKHMHVHWSTVIETASGMINILTFAGIFSLSFKTVLISVVSKIAAKSLHNETFFLRQFSFKVDTALEPFKNL